MSELTESILEAKRYAEKTLEINTTRRAFIIFPASDSLGIEHRKSL